MKVTSLLVYLASLIFVTIAFDRNNTESQECQICGCNTNCVDNVCQCKEGHEGDPIFMCFEKNATECSIRNDPRVDVFYNRHYSEKLIGDVLAADFITDRKAEGDGQCYVKVWTYLNRIKGKMYVTEVQINLTQVSGDKRSTLVMKIVASIIETANYSSPNVYVFDAYYLFEGAFVYWFQSRSDTPFIMSRNIRTAFCELDFIRIRPNIFKVEAYCCGVVIGIRPYNPKPPQATPGFFININSSYNPVFPEYPVAPPLCLYGHQTNVSNITGFSNYLDSLIYLALTNSDVSPPFGNTPSNLAYLRGILKACSTEGKQSFISFFQDVLNDPPFVYSISNNVPGLYELVNFLLLVLKDICGLDANGCSQAQALINARVPNATDPAPILQPYCAP
ncbi:uncharacterized protein LOC106055316 [Biomphalaria glabrata]|uniref:Uncharacterized protein LOC106055316 n=1 Tax=Biomphalaria glabrata TaxID=6526 RepID=A0A9W2ZA26_BIOGL|nr:uncharacterized protein LOC106055316 [Biomphalaria glabrata]